MIKKLTEESSLKFKNLSPEEKAKKGILGRLYGNICTWATPTRNERYYSKSLWEKLFNSDLIKERFAAGGVYGELTHPDREDIDFEKVAIVMPEPPKADQNGNLVGYVDIIDTPCGRIAYQLAKYGYKFGISTRGSGDLIEGVNGEEEVDPDTYSLTAVDLVEIPAVESARLEFTESLDKTRYHKTLRQTLKEELNKASEEDRKSMEEALKSMNIDLTEGRILTKSGPMSKQEEHKIIDSFVDEKGERHFKLDTNVWVTEKDVDSIEADQDTLAELNTENQEEDISSDNPVTEEVEESDDQFVRDNWEKILKGIKSMGGSVDSLTKIYNEMKDNKNEGCENLSEEESDSDSINEKLDLSYEDDFDAFNYGVSSIYDTLEEIIRQFRFSPNNISFSDLDDMCEKAIIRLQDKWDLEEGCNKNESCNEACSDKNEVEEKVGNTKDLKELQESLVKASKLEKDNLSLQEKLSVSNAKEKELEEELKKYKTSTAKLSTVAKQAKSLKEELNKAYIELNSNEDNLKANKLRLEKFKTQTEMTTKELNESNAKVEELSSKVEDLNEKLTKYSLAIKKYQKALKESKNAYINIKAENIGIKPEEILSKLNESFSLKDVDSICEELERYKTTIDKLPFVINENTRIKAKASPNEYIRGRAASDTDDYISDSLLRAINE